MPQTEAVPIQPSLRPAPSNCSHTKRQLQCTRTQWIVGKVAAEQVRLLQANGVDEFHFYTLNRPDLTYAIAHVLGVRADTAMP